ncbi:MAG: ABC transporter permease, partial [Thermoanaerobaculia bacterium]
MILGNSLTGISLCLDRFLDHLEVRADEVELRIAFGATRREALAAPLRNAVRTGMI